MSVFDKFNANPYQSTYIGAPIEEMAQAMAARTARADDFYSREDALEDAFAADAHFSADDALFNERQTAIRNEIEELAKNPHQNSRRIKSLARQYGSNAELTLGRKNYKAYKDWEAKFEEDPTKYGGEVTAGLAANKLNDYKGAASGGTLKFDRLYEHKDINETMVKAAATIKDNQNFEQTSDGRFINTVTKKYITEEEVASVLIGTIKNDPTILKQIKDHTDFYGGTPEDYITQLIQPQVQAIAHADYSSKLTSIPKAGKSGSGSGDDEGMRLSWQGPSVKSGTHDQFRGMDAVETLEFIKGLNDNSEEKQLYTDEYKEYLTNNLAGKLTGTSDRRMLEYINQADVGQLMDIANGRLEGYKHWQEKTLGYAVDLSNGAQRNITQDLTNTFFNRDAGANFGDGFADKYSAGTNTVINNSRQVLQGMGFSNSDITDIKNNQFNQLFGQNEVQILTEGGEKVTMGSDEFKEKYASGELVGFADDSDLAMFKVSMVDSDLPDQRLYIRLPANTFSVTADRVNKTLKEGYGDGTNVNYRKVGKAVMGMNEPLKKQATMVTSLLNAGNKNARFPLSDLSPNLTGVGTFDIDADGNVSFLINGKNMIKGNEELQTTLNQAVRQGDASTVAGVLAAVGYSTEK